MKYFKNLSDWNTVAAFLLDDKTGDITECIAKSNHHDVGNCCAAMIREYMNSGTLSWEFVCTSLREAEQKNLALKIEKEVGITSTCTC